MKQLNSLSIFFTLILLLLVPNLAAAMIDAEAAKIPYQVNNSDRIVIGTVSRIDTYPSYTIYTIRVKEWLYNSIPAETIKVRSNIGANLAVEDEVEFAQNESALLMLNDENLDKQLFRVFVGFAGKRPVSDRGAVIEELKVQGKWQEENQTGNKIDETKVVENTETEDEQKENQTVNNTNGTKTVENTGTTAEQEENSNHTQKSNTTPFMTPVCVLAAMLGAIIYIRRKQ
jgi:hypothetical protein